LVGATTPPVQLVADSQFPLKLFFVVFWEKETEQTTDTSTTLSQHFFILKSFVLQITTSVP